MTEDRRKKKAWTELQLVCNYYYRHSCTRKSQPIPTHDIPHILWPDKLNYLGDYSTGKTSGNSAQFSLFLDFSHYKHATNTLILHAALKEHENYPWIQLHLFNVFLLLFEYYRCLLISPVYDRNLPVDSMARLDTPLPGCLQYRNDVVLVAVSL